MPAVTVDLTNLFVETDALRLAELVRQKEVTLAKLTETAILNLRGKRSPKWRMTAAMTGTLEVAAC